MFVGPETESIFNDDFWEELSFVVNAVDNLKARLYVDQRCVWFEKPLLESGTLGTKANSQMVIPHVTQCYGDTTDPPEEGIPMCTLRNFPHLIEHCIEWGRDFFNRLFVDRASEALGYLEKPDTYIAQLKKSSQSLSEVRETLEEVQKFLEIKNSADFSKCVQIAREYFENFFNHTIQNLLHMFPVDYVDEKGQLFWSGSKRAPTAIAFNPEDPLHVHFISSTANLIAFNMGIP